MTTENLFPNGSGNGSGTGATATIEFEARDVTGTHTIVARGVQRDMPAGVVARALASRLALPDNVPWTLRDDATSAFVDDARPIGDQIAPDARVTLTMKAHLG